MDQFPGNRIQHPVSFHHTGSVVRYHDSSSWKGEWGTAAERSGYSENNVNPGSFYQKTSRRIIITKLYKGIFVIIREEWRVPYANSRENNRELYPDAATHHG
jgi:hypothetical protein